jgi:hypothetical protein
MIRAIRSQDSGVQGAADRAKAITAWRNPSMAADFAEYTEKNRAAEMSLRGFLSRREIPDRRADYADQPA